MSSVVGEGRKQEGKGDDDIFCFVLFQRLCVMSPFRLVLRLVFIILYLVIGENNEKEKEDPRKKGLKCEL